MTLEQSSGRGSLWEVRSSVYLLFSSLRARSQRPLRSEEVRLDAGLPGLGAKGLCGLFLGSVFGVFAGCLGRAIQLEN